MKFASFLVVAFLLFSAVTGHAATLSQQLDPPEANVGDIVSLTYTVQNGGGGVSVSLPPVDGLQVDPSIITGSKFSFSNGAISSSAWETFRLMANRPGDFTIPAFNIHLPDGGVLRTKEMKLHILGNPSAPAPSQQVPSNPTPQANAMAIAPPVPAPNPNGPVIFPPNNNPPPAANPAAPAPNTATLDTGNGGTVTIPTEPDGRPAKVFIIITPQTTDTYVGESIPMHIEFYIRQDVDAQQDSLPTIKGSDFLMNNLSVRFRVDGVMIMNEPFRRESWFTAISAPKSGDFPLQMERDTYWRKPVANDPNVMSFFATRPDLAHEAIPSNQFTVHVHDVPADGRPASFSGAIGQFTATGGAQPLTVAVGEPVTLHFSINGQGNFDYVRCPAIPEDAAWKAYVPSSKIAYQDESHTQGVKNFEMAIIPQKSGTLQLPQANFSYFDPSTKKYSNIPIDLPAITVTGSAASTTPTGSATDVASAPVDTSSPDWFAPNRVASGSARTNLAPVFWQPWFWAVQGGLLGALILCAIAIYLRSRPKPDNGAAEKLERENALLHELDAMTAARQQKDSQAFFLAARHAVQLHLGNQWRVKPETLTLGEIRLRDPALAESLEPLFHQSDEIIYSGGTASGLDLAHWERHVLELLQPQPQPAKS